MKSPKYIKYYTRGHDLYVYQNVEYEDLAKLFPVSVSTWKKWSAQNNWDEERVAAQTSPWMVASKMREGIFRIIQRLEVLSLSDDQEGFVNRLKQEADSLSKLMAIAEKLDKKANVLGHAQLILRDMADYLKKHHPDLAKEFGNRAFIGLTDYLWSKYSQ